MMSIISSPHPHVYATEFPQLLAGETGFGYRETLPSFEQDICEHRYIT